jgi:ABC-type uncharacterized transport system fused permease/ATPase subunit
MNTVAYLLNLVDENPLRLAISRRQQERGKAERKVIREQMEKQRSEGKTIEQEVNAIDMIPLSMLNVFVTHGHPVRDSHEQAQSKHTHVPTFEWNAWQVHQGRLVSITGVAGSGKATFLKLLAGSLIPNDGEVEVPPHLSVRHVSLSPTLFTGTLLENITYGVDAGSPSGSLDRVLHICKRLGFPARTLEQIQSDEIQNWSAVLPATEQRLLHLGRALVSDPEVLIMQMPLQGLAETSAKRVLALMNTFVTERGVGRDLETLHRRRPRTVVFSVAPSDILGLRSADDRFLVDRDSIKVIGVEDLSAEWFTCLAKSAVE